MSQSVARNAEHASLATASLRHALPAAAIALLAAVLTGFVGLHSKEAAPAPVLAQVMTPITATVAATPGVPGTAAPAVIQASYEAFDPAEFPLSAFADAE